MKTTTNYSVIKSLLLEEILGENNSKEISQKLGYNFDQYYRWINNLKVLKWDEFIKICQTFNLAITEAYSSFTPNLSTNADAKTLINILKESSSFKSNQELANYLNCHVSVLKRYLAGTTIPNTEIIFKLIDLHPEQFRLFIKRLLVKNIENSTLKTFIEPTYQSMLTSSRYPQTAIIEALLLMQDYLERDLKIDTTFFLSQKLNLSLEETEKLVRLMLENGKIESQGPHFAPSLLTTNFSGIPFEDAINFYYFLLDTFKTLIQNKVNGLPSFGKTPGMMAGRIVPMSVKSMNRVNEILARAHDEIISTCEKDDDPKVECRALLLLTGTIIK